MGKRANNEGSVYQRKDGKWVAQVIIGQYPNGRPKYKRYVCDKQSAATAELRAAKNSLDQGRKLDAKLTTAGTYLDHWLENVIEPADREAKTKQSHAYHVALLKPKIGHVKLDKLTPEHVEQCLHELRSRGGRHGKGYAQSTVAHTRSTLRKALGHAVRNGRLALNVATLIDPPTVRREEPQPFTEDQSLGLLDAVEGSRWEVLYAVALTLGLRKGEILALQWSDVDWHKQTLHVRRQLEHLPGQKPRLKPLLKTAAGRRDLDLPHDLVRRLRAHQDRQRIEQHKAGDGWLDVGLVFPTSQDTPITPRNLSRHFAGLLARAGLRLRGFHQLRHTAATMMFARGLDVVKVSRILGHASVKITSDTYIHWLPKDSGEAAAIMDGFLTKRRERAS